MIRSHSPSSCSAIVRFFGDLIDFRLILWSKGPWMETMSRRFHTIDANSDGRVTRREYDAFFRGRDEEQERQRNQADNFFKQLVGYLL